MVKQILVNLRMKKRRRTEEKRRNRRKKKSKQVMSLSKLRRRAMGPKEVDLSVLATRWQSAIRGH